MSVSDAPVTFGEFVDAHQTEILRYLTRLTGNGSDADDLFQETFLRALGAFDRLRAGSNHRAWLYRIATNAFLNHRRAATRRAEVVLPDEMAGNGPSPGARHEAAATAAAVRQAVRRLSRRQRAAFIQRTIDGCSYGDIGASLGCSSQTARAHVYQAVRRLRREISDRKEGQR